MLINKSNFAFKRIKKVFLIKKYIQQPIELKEEKEEEETKKKKEKNRKQQEKEIVSESFHKFEIDSKRVFHLKLWLLLLLQFELQA